MRLEDLDIEEQQEMFDRQDEAERRRLMREASNAFMRASERPAPPRLRREQPATDPLEGMRGVIAYVAASYGPKCLGGEIEP